MSLWWATAKFLAIIGSTLRMYAERCIKLLTASAWARGVLVLRARGSWMAPRALDEGKSGYRACRSWYGE